MTTVQVSNWDERETCTLMEHSLPECLNLLRGKRNISTIQPLSRSIFQLFGSFVVCPYKFFPHWTPWNVFPAQIAKDKTQPLAKYVQNTITYYGQIKKTRRRGQKWKRKKVSWIFEMLSTVYYVYVGPSMNFWLEIRNINETSIV